MKTHFQVVFLIIIALILMPVSASSENTTNTTVVLTTTQQPVTLSAENTTTVATTAVITTIAAVNTTSTVPQVNVTTVPQTDPTPVQNITVATTTPAGSPVTQGTTGNLTVASSPLGASVLIDGVYSGVTPGEISGVAGGNHMVRLTLSGYYDYEGTTYVVPGQVTHVFGTLQPLGGHVDSATTQALVTTPALVATVQPTATSTSSPLENPTVIAAIIGIITASIGAGATIFTHFAKMKKE